MFNELKLGTYKNHLNEVIVVNKIYDEYYRQQDMFGNIYNCGKMKFANITYRGKNHKMFLFSLCDYIERYGFKIENKIGWD